MKAFKWDFATEQILTPHGELTEDRSIHRTRKSLFLPFAFQGGIIKVLHKLLQSAKARVFATRHRRASRSTIPISANFDLNKKGGKKNKRPQYSSFHFCSLGAP